MVRSLAFFPTQHCGALRAGHSFPPSPLRQAYRGGQRLRRSPRQAGGLVPLRAGLTPQQAQAAEPGGNSATSAAPDSTGHGTASNGSPSATNGSSSNGIGTGAGKTTVVAKEDFTKFVQFFRGASPYIEGHRGRCFVIVVPGQVVAERPLFSSLMSDIALLHGLGVQVVLVLGTAPQIDAGLAARGHASLVEGGYRRTDAVALEVACEAAGKARTWAEQALSKGPSVPMLRRHKKGDTEIHYEPALRCVSGNYVTAKRRGIIDGVDYMYTGEVRFVLKDAVKKQLDDRNIVLLSNLGFTAAGELLNCNTYDVGLHAAVELGADKLIFMHTDELRDLALPPWLPLSDAQSMLLRRLGTLPQGVPQADVAMLTTVEQEQAAAAEAAADACAADAKCAAEWSASGAARPPNYAPPPANANGKKASDVVLNLDTWAAVGFPTSFATCVIACCKGVKRAHLVDAHTDGGLLLELYSREGVGTMISTDFYEGIRAARPADLDGIEALLRPLEDSGVLVRRSREDLIALLPHFTVIECEGRPLACALLLPLGNTEDGTCTAELGAFCVDASFRGSGRGDSLLDYVEQGARKAGIQRLVLLTTRTADWFQARDFTPAGPAWQSDMLPAARRAKINPARNSQLYVKALEAPDESIPLPGKRIGW